MGEMIIFKILQTLHWGNSSPLIKTSAKTSQRLSCFHQHFNYRWQGWFYLIPHKFCTCEWG